MEKDMVYLFSYEGFWFPVLEAIINEVLRKECIVKGLVRAKQFSWENVAKRLIQIYSNL